MKCQVHLKSVISRTDLDKPFSVCINGNNQSCNSGARHEALNEFPKHVEAKLRFVVDNVKSGTGNAEHIEKNEIVAHIFKKHLAYVKFLEMLVLAGICKSSLSM